MTGSIFSALFGGAYISGKLIKDSYQADKSRTDKLRRGVDDYMYFSTRLMSTEEFISLYEKKTGKELVASKMTIIDRELYTIELMDLAGKISELFPYKIYKSEYDRLKYDYHK